MSAGQFNQPSPVAAAGGRNLELGWLKLGECACVQVLISWLRGKCRNEATRLMRAGRAVCYNREGESLVRLRTGAHEWKSQAIDLGANAIALRDTIVALNEIGDRIRC